MWWRSSTGYGGTSPVPNRRASTRRPSLLGDLLRAMLDGAHLNVVYDLIGPGVSEWVVFPYGLYTSRDSDTALVLTGEGRRTSL